MDEGFLGKSFESSSVMLTRPQPAEHTGADCNMDERTNAAWVSFSLPKLVRKQERARTILAR